MPEFPEVYTITNNLRDLLEGSTLLRVEYLDYHPQVPSIEELKKLENKKISQVMNISKNIQIEFEKQFLRIHLGMTGRIRHTLNSDTLFGWDKIRFEFDKGGEKFFLNFTDTRKFGKISLHRSPIPSKGLNPLSYTQDEAEGVVSKILKSHKEIKDLILDQSLISGLGNIYSNDTLFHSKIHPQTKGILLTKKQVEQILSSAKYVLDQGIKFKGSSLYDKMYTDIYGNEGEYQNHFLVYNQKNCKECLQEILKIKIKGRGTYFCPNCQK